MKRSRTTIVALATTLAITAVGCADDPADESVGDGTDPAPSSEVVLVTHDSFALSPEVLEAFTAETGIEVRLLPSGDAGAAVNRAVLTAGDPEGDVLFGVDGALLGRALDAELFEPYESPALAHVPDELVVDPHVTPIDRGDVCLNVDLGWFEQADVPLPTDLDDLVEPAYAGLTVVEDPASSSPGLAFLFATWERYGEEGWEAWWSDLVDNDVEVVSGWEAAYYGSFSGGSGEGDRPIVVSYATSPVAEVVFAAEPTDIAPTASVTATCIEQVEYAGILAGTDRRSEAEALVDFLLSPEVQADIPLQMFVHPVRDDVELPDVVLEHGPPVADPIRLPIDEMDARRDDLLDRWSAVVLG